VAEVQEQGGSLRQPPVRGIDTKDDAQVILLGGELDLYNAEAMREALFTACSGGPPKIVVDLSEVEFMDSTALGVLIEARTKLPNRNAFLLAAPGLETKRALHISGLDRHFSVHESVDDALAAEV
jgi:anti-sigma B factor antagonist